MIASSHRLRKHVDYQRVYRSGRKQYTRNMAYFYALRVPWSAAQAQTTPRTLLDRCAPLLSANAGANAAPHDAHGAGSRVGLTVPKALGNAVVRNRIKRRMREAVRHALPLLQAPVDLVLHPRRVVLDMEFAQLEREVAGLFRSVEAACQRAARSTAAEVTSA